MKQTISLRQMGAIAGLMVFANKILVLPSLFFDKVGVDGLFILIGYFAIELLLIAIFFRVKKCHPNESLFEILSHVFTKYGAYFIYALLAIYFLVKAVSSFNVSLMYLKNQVYFEAEDYIFLLCFLTIANNLTFRGVRGMGRTIEFFFIIIAVLAIFNIYGSSVNFMGFPVFFNSSLAKLTTSSFSYIFWFGDSLFFFVIIDKIELKNGRPRTVYLFTLFAMTIVTMLHTIFYSAFRYTGFMHNNAASDVLTFSNKFAGIGRIDIAAVAVVMLLYYFLFAIYNIAFDETFGHMFPKRNKLYSVVVFDLAFILLLTLLITDFTKAIMIAMNYMPYLAVILQYILPFVCLIICFVRRKKNE